MNPITVSRGHGMQMEFSSKIKVRGIIHHTMTILWRLYALTTLGVQHWRFYHLDEAMKEVSIGFLLRIIVPSFNLTSLPGITITNVTKEMSTKSEVIRIYAIHSYFPWCGAVKCNQRRWNVQNFTPLAKVERNSIHTKLQNNCFQS